MLVNPVCGKPNRGKCYFPCPRSGLEFWSSERGSSVPSRISQLIPHILTESVVLGGLLFLLPLSATVSHLYRQNTIESAPSFIKSTQLRTDGAHHRDSVVSRVHRVTLGCFLFGYSIGPMDARSSFSHTLYSFTVEICDIGNCFVTNIRLGLRQG